MLTLSVTRGEPVRLLLPGGEVIWVVAETRADGRGVTLCIEAPRDVQIHRNSILPPEERRVRGGSP